MRYRLVFGVLVFVNGLGGAVPAGAPFLSTQSLFSDDFKAGLANWIPELERPGAISARDGVLSVDVPAGCTLWFRPELSGPVMIQYEARMVQAGGPNDRVSDLNAFWMATDAFGVKRSGKFSDYNNLRTYYVGQGGNSNTTTRFRRYIGDAVERPLLPEHDLRSPDVLLKPNVWQTVTLVALGDRIQYYRDGRLIFDFHDPAPYTRGHFAFRTTQSHVELRDFHVWRIAAAQAVSAHEDAAGIQLDNGLIALDYSKASATFVGIYRYIDGKRHAIALGQDAYYWDTVSHADSVAAGVDVPANGNFTVRKNPDPPKLILSDDAAEIIAPAHHNGWFLFDVDVHYVLRRGDPGFYAWAVLRHPAELGGTELAQMRFVSKTVTDGTFTQFVIGEQRVKTIDRSEKTQELANATYRLADGTISTKYQNSSYWAETPVYGHAGPQIGLWSISASPEFHNGGPLKQGQTVHDNVLLRVMTSVHFGAAGVKVAAGEAWSKVYGPVFTYINAGDGIAELWADAQARQDYEAARWPYQWVSSPEYVKERGTLAGTWRLHGEAAQTGAWVVLAAASHDEKAPDWTMQSKGYEFWTHTGPDGRFTIPNVIPGTYTMFVSGADQPTQFSADGIVIQAGKTTVRDVDWTPVRNGATLWQIGTFDRTAAEFRNGDNARDFEMFKRYPKDFPEDVTYTIGMSDPARDWNYAQWALYVKKPVWTVRFEQRQAAEGTATLTIAFSSAQPQRGAVTNLQVKVNGELIDTIHLPKTGTAGYRGSAQDSPWNVRTLKFNAHMLRPGMNEITFGHADARPVPADGNIAGPVGQVMYDAIRLEVTGP